MNRLAWRAMNAGDLDGVVAVARDAFPAHFEARACFAERLALYPQGCMVLADGQTGTGEVKGYLIGYPWPLGAIPPLNSGLGALPKAGDAFYLHDLALGFDARGQGHARPAVEQLARHALNTGAKVIALVSVNDSVPFWQGMGFEPVAADPVITRKLASYGPNACYMTRR